MGIYGWPSSSEKHNTWRLIRDLSVNYHGPILFGGDFNEIIRHGEKGGGAVTDIREIYEFQEALYDYNLQDLGYEGQWYTWERGRSCATIVRERLNRYYGNAGWFSLFPEVSIQYLLRFKSDHTPILIRQNDQKGKEK